MINRVTNTGVSAAAQRNLQAAMVRLATVQEKASSLKEISRPSDDPAGAADAMAVRAQQRANEQYTRNAQDAQLWLSTVDNALSDATSVLHRVRDLTVRGANDGALSPAGREAIAIELEELRDGLVAAANTQVMGRSVFAGTSDAGAALGPGNTFGGGTGTVERRTGPSTTVRVDAPGAEAFGEGDASVFSLVQAIADDLRAGTNVGPRLGELDGRLQAVLSTQAAVGARHATAIAAADALLDDAVALEGRRGSLEDADLGTVALELKTQEVAYQAALSASARTLQPTLMDFLR